MSQAWDMEKNGPGQTATAISPVDSVDLVDVARALYIGVGGNLKVTMVGGMDVTFMGLQAGTVYPFAVTKVFSGSTTCASIVALR